ncbi:MAG: hypothetical protein FWE03_03925 [Firmicutes bacterium]|nr:hypothetical protein [Bacillota bacterium]
MKKRTSLLLIIMVVAVMAFSLTACANPPTNAEVNGTYRCANNISTIVVSGTNVDNRTARARVTNVRIGNAYVTTDGTFDVSFNRNGNISGTIQGWDQNGVWREFSFSASWNI